MIRTTLSALLILFALIAMTQSAPLPLGNLGLTQEEKLELRLELEEAVLNNPEDIELRFELGMNEVDLALNDNEEAAERALRIFEAIYEEHPTRYDALALYGNAATIRAKYAYIPFKMYWVKRGFNAMDEAVELDPDDIAVRLIRAANSSQVPGFLGRGRLAQEDFAWLKNKMAEEPQAFDDSTRQAMYYFAAQYALRQNDEACISLLEEALAITGPDGLQEEILAFYKKARERFPYSEPNPSSQL